jgi:hypothetical protein
MIKIIKEREPTSLVRYFALTFFALLVLLLFSGLVSKAFAADMSAVLIPNRNKTDATFVAVRTITMKYPLGSSAAQELESLQARVQFTMNGTAGQQDDGNVGDLIASMNKALLDVRSPVQASALSVTYTGVFVGGDNDARLSYKVELKPTLEDFVLQRGEGGSSGDIIDLEWRALAVDGPVVLNSPEGPIDINRPIGLLESKFPTLADTLKNSQAKEMMEDSIINFNQFGAPMSVWHVLFDPVGVYGGEVGLEGTEGASVISVYALGEGSLREGAHRVEENDATADIAGTQVNIHSQDAPPSAQIQIAGYAKAQESGGAEVAVVTADAPPGVVTSSGPFPIQVLLIFGGMMGAIAIFILFKARK